MSLMSDTQTLFQAPTRWTEPKKAMMTGQGEAETLPGSKAEALRRRNGAGLEGQ